MLFRNRYYLNGRQWKRGEKNNRNVCSAANGLMVYRYAQYSLSPHFLLLSLMYVYIVILLPFYVLSIQSGLRVVLPLSSHSHFKRRKFMRFFLPFFSSFTSTRRNAKKALKRFFLQRSQPATMKLFLFSHLRWWWLQYGSLFDVSSLTRDVCGWAHVY